jgi:hypothetical protein
MTLIAGGSDVVRIDSSGNVGIGTSSPSSYHTNKLVIDIGADNQNGMTIVSETTKNGMISFADGTTAENRYRGYINYNHGSNFLQFGTDATERMRIDSSGNVGIGTTTPITPLQVNRDISGVTDALSLRANSNVTNEYIGLNFAKATWGKMAGIYGRNENNGNADGRLSFYTSSGGTYAERLGITSSGLIFPGSDNTQDLGSSGSRFNDLYLGGGLYVGGTGSANYLDDYEEGTWTPTVAFGGGSTGQSYGARRVGKYTKIGRVVHLEWFLILSNIGSSTGTFTLTGLPFTHSSTDQPFTSGAIMINGISHDGHISAGIGSGENSLSFYTTATSGTRRHTSNSNWSNGDEIAGGITYITDA